MSKKQKPTTLMVEDADIGFRNFSGEEGTYNRKGERNFALFIQNAELEARLLDEGWNVKYLKPREDGDLPQPYLRVAVNFAGHYPPQVFLIQNGKRSQLNEDTVSLLDWAEITNADMVINPYEWEFPSPEGMKHGVKAYLKSLYVTLRDDPFSEKYADIPEGPESAQSIMMGGSGVF